MVALVSIIFVGHKLFDNWHKVGDYSFTLESVGMLLLNAIGYACACLLLASAWYQILSALCVKSFPVQLLRAIYARSQIAKYIPGNVMQLTGRHVMIRRLGVAYKPLAIASLVEIIGLLSASCTVALVGSAAFGLWGSYINQTQIYYGLGIVAILLLLLPVIRYISLKFISVSRHFLSNPYLHWAFLRAYLEYLLFFVIAGFILVGLVYQFHNNLNLYNIAALIATFSISWLAGFITPGAPSGIGIRETILVVSLDKIFPGGDSVLIAILFRIVTVVGDILFFTVFGNCSGLINQDTSKG